MSEIKQFHATTVIGLRHKCKAVIAGDGQVTYGDTVMKAKARKVRKLYADKVLAGFQNSFQKTLKAVQALTEQDLIDPQRFEWREGDPLWHMVAANTWWHYKEHRETISRWLKETQQSP